MAEEDTWESRENLKNAMELVEEFEKEYCSKEKEEVRRLSQTSFGHNSTDT